MPKRLYEFSWDLIGDLKAGRPNMGINVSLILYRLMQYTFRDVLEQRYGTEACDTFFYEAGKLAGTSFFDQFLEEYKNLPLNSFVAELQRAVKDQGIGILRIEKADVEKGKFVLTIAEDLDCSGLPDLGVEVCNYDEGFVAGIFDGYTGQTFKAREVDCWCSGERVCRFEVNRI
ncbi:MAG: 4-vinyl reductase [Planctomycetaceae bacterium]|nr:4-vinyl reductase [Planctomycetaceae bacterium]